MSEIKSGWSVDIYDSERPWRYPRRDTRGRGLRPLPPRHSTWNNEAVHLEMSYGADTGYREAMVVDPATGRVIPQRLTKLPLAEMVGICDEPAGVRAGEVGRMYLPDGRHKSQWYSGPSAD